MKNFLRVSLTALAAMPFVAMVTNWAPETAFGVTAITVVWLIAISVVGGLVGSSR